MNLRHLEIFKVVCKHMSITKAADELFMTQPAVSITIKELEDFYHTKLFDRLGRKIYLTTSGEKLLSYANTIMNQFDLSVEDIRNQHNLASCTIGMNVTIGEGYSSHFISYLKKQIPQLQPKVIIDNVVNIEHRFKDNEFDFIITDSPQNVNHHYILEKLHNEKMVAVCSPTFGIKDNMEMEDLIKYPLLLREQGSGSRRCINNAFDAHGLVACPTIESSSHFALIELTKNNHGITIIPESLVTRSLKVVYQFDEKFSRDYYLLYHDSKNRSPIIKKAIVATEDYFKMFHKK